MSDDDKEKDADADFVTKETVEDKSTESSGDAENSKSTVQQTKSEHKENN